jgi:hypothetical protein
MFRSYDHPQGAYFVPCYSYSLKHSVIYFVTLIWCCDSMSCVVGELYAVQLRLAVGVLVVPYSVRLHIGSRSQLNTAQLTPNTPHAATAPNLYNEVNH